MIPKEVLAISHIPSKKKSHAVFITAGLEYKFMVKSVDPDATTAVTKNENDQKDVVKSITHDLHEQSMEENMADNIGERHPQNQTGKKHK